MIIIRTRQTQKIPGRFPDRGLCASYQYRITPDTNCWSCSAFGKLYGIAINCVGLRLAILRASACFRRLIRLPGR